MTGRTAGDQAPTELRVFDEAVDLWGAMAARWREIAAAAVAARGVFTAALSGGRTPLGFYCHLSRQEGLPWGDTELFQVDERFVPPDDEGSNGRMIRSSLLNGGGVRPRDVHFIDTGAETAGEAARRYEDELKRSLGGGEALPVLDLVLLGVGADGHTASLFPGGAEVEERSRWVLSSLSPDGPRERITLGLPLLNNARHVFFLATGSRKAAILGSILGEPGDRSLPAARVRPLHGSLSFFIDRAAGKDVRLPSR